MSITTIPDRPPEDLGVDTSADRGIATRLDELEAQIERGNREGRSAGRTFSIFAAIALVIALVNLVVIAAKLDSSSTSTQAARSTMPAAGMPGAGGAAATAPAHRVAVTLREYTIGTTSTVGASGRVSFAVRNAGTMPHEFVVIRTPKPAASLLQGTKADETGNVGETGDLQPGQTKTIALALKPGHYALICNLPGHYMAGQHRDFTVR